MSKRNAILDAFRRQTESFTTASPNNGSAANPGPSASPGNQSVPKKLNRLDAPTDKELFDSIDYPVATVRSTRATAQKRKRHTVVVLTGLRCSAFPIGDDTWREQKKINKTCHGCNNSLSKIGISSKCFNSMLDKSYTQST
jgi:hypothetical protein